jgi:hypothetical protein
MQQGKILLSLALAAASTLTILNASAQKMDNFGQVIQIQTNLTSFIGKPTWLLIIRDLDHGQNIPYVYDLTSVTNFWIALSFSKDYVIIASEMTLNPYDKKIRNFCNLESMGAIQHGTSMSVELTGRLSRNTNLYTCHAAKYPDTGSSMATPN